MIKERFGREWVRLGYTPDISPNPVSDKKTDDVCTFLKIDELYLNYICHVVFPSLLHDLGAMNSMREIHLQKPLRFRDPGTPWGSIGTSAFEMIQDATNTSWPRYLTDLNFTNARVYVYIYIYKLIHVNTRVINDTSVKISFHKVRISESKWIEATSN